MATEGRVLGPYRLAAPLGTGGMGAVWRAVVEGDGAAPGLERGQVVAVKLIHPHLLAKPGFFERFRREARLGREVRHENVVRTYDADAVVADGATVSYLVMELVEGQTLRELVAEMGRVPEELCRHVACETAKALGAIHHAGIVHRDLKPENVLITRNEVVKVMDLGVAHLQDEALRLSETGQFVGSVLYGAPEQFETGGRRLDGRADLYALGLLLHEIATGRHPFREDDIAKIIRRQLSETPRRLGEFDAQITPFFEEVVATLLEKDRERRFASARDLVEVLEDGEASSWWQRRSSEIRAEKRRPLRRLRVARETAIYGRDAELAQLFAAWDGARAGDGRVVLVTGEAGVGKSRIVDEFTTRLQREGEEVHVLFGAYPPGGAATEIGAFATAFREHFGAEDLARRLAPYLTVTPLLVPAFAAMLRGEPTPPGHEPLTKDSLQTVFVHALRALAAERPTVLLIDELHFAPEEGRALFAALALAAPGHRVLLLGAARRGLPEEWLASLERLEHVTQMELGRLGPRALQQLLADALRSDRLAEDVSARIAVKSDGNPFFVFEILGDLRERGVLERRADGAWSTTSEIRDIRIPSTVKDLIRTRLEGLGADDRDLLDVASVAGYEFDAVLVGDALGLGRIPTLKRLARIERQSRLVRSAGERYVFDHPQVQEALYAGLAAPLAREYHAALGDALERGSGAGDAKRPEDVDDDVVLGLADHFLKGGQGPRARRWLGAALTILESRQLADAAAEMAGRALATKGLLAGRDRAEILLRRGEQLEILGRREEERAGLEEAVRLADEAGDFALASRAHRALGIHAWAVSRYDEARTLLEEARALAARADDRVGEVRAMVDLGSVLRSQGRYEDASRLLTQSLERARALGDRGLEAQAATSLAAMAQNLGRYAEAERHTLEALETARAAGDRRREAMALVTLGIVLGHLGRYEEARRHLEVALATARAIGDRHTEGLATGNLGLVFAYLGRLDRALEHPERWLAIAREIGDRNCEGSATGSLGLALLAAGRGEEARAQHERHLDIAKEIGYRLGREHATYALGLLADLEGRADDAERLLEEAVALQRESGHRRGLAYSLLALGRLLCGRGRVDPAREALEGARVLARMMGLAGPQALAAVHLALLPGGDVEDAKATVAALEARLGHAERLEARFLLWRATRERAHLEEAHRLLLVLRDATPRNLRDAMYQGSPLRRDVLAAWRETRATQA